MIVLPAKPNNGADDTRGQLGVLATPTTAAGGARGDDPFAVGSRRDDPLYVHAKVAIVDDRWLTVGSANLNAHSLLNDTEMNVVTDDPAAARDTRVRLWAEHLELDEATVAGAGRTAGRRALAPDCRRAARAPPARPAADAPAAGAAGRVASARGRLLGPLQGLIDDG